MVKIYARFLAAFWFWRGSKFRQIRRLQIESRLYGRRIRRVAKSVGALLVVRAPSTVTKTTTIGTGCVFNGVRVYGEGEVTIGDHVLIGNETVVYSANHDYDTGDAIPYGTGWTPKPVRIDDCVWIASRVIILPGAHIGEGAIIQAGSVVHGEIPPFAIAGGNPAKVFAWRDREHYEELKAKGRFTLC